MEQMDMFFLKIVDDIKIDFFRGMQKILIMFIPPLLISSRLFKIAVPSVLYGKVYGACLGP